MIRYVPTETADIAVIHEQARLLIEQYEDLSAISLPDVLAWEKRKIEKKLSEYTRIEQDGHAVGYFHLSEDSDGCLELDDFYVLPPFRGQGIGTEALRRCIAESERVGKPLTLCVFTGNICAIRLYRRMGFDTVRALDATREIMLRPLKKS